MILPQTNALHSPTIELTEEQLARWNHVRARAGVDCELTMPHARRILQDAKPEDRAKILEYLG